MGDWWEWPDQQLTLSRSLLSGWGRSLFSLSRDRVGTFRIAADRGSAKHAWYSSHSISPVWEGLHSREPAQPRTEEGKQSHKQAVAARVSSQAVPVRDRAGQGLEGGGQEPDVGIDGRGRPR
jgi:hypothetical protein